MTAVIENTDARVAATRGLGGRVDDRIVLGDHRQRIIGYAEVDPPRSIRRSGAFVGKYDVVPGDVVVTPRGGEYGDIAVVRGHRLDGIVDELDARALLKIHPVAAGRDVVVGDSVVADDDILRRIVDEIDTVIVEPALELVAVDEAVFRRLRLHFLNADIVPDLKAVGIRQRDARRGGRGECVAKDIDVVAEGGVDTDIFKRTILNYIVVVRPQDSHILRRIAEGDARLALQREVGGEKDIVILERVVESEWIRDDQRIARHAERYRVGQRRKVTTGVADGVGVADGGGVLRGEEPSGGTAEQYRQRYRNGRGFPHNQQYPVIDRERVHSGYNSFPSSRFAYSSS